MEQAEDPLSKLKKPSKLVYIFNMSEDVWPFIASISDLKVRQHEIDENAFLADRELFSIADKEQAIFISPVPVDPEFVRYYQDLFNIRDINIMVPAIHTGCVCTDIKNDSKLMDQLIDAANSVKRLTLVPYSTSHEFIKLVKTLQTQGINVATPESPDEPEVWSVNFYGSKSGIRQLANTSQAIEPDFKVPEGMICADLNDAAMMAANKYLKNGGVVIKTNKGHSGAGVLIFRQGDLPNEYEACRKAIVNIFHKDAYWEQFSIVIEDLVNVNYTVGGGFPNVEFKITKSGQINMLYMCGMRITKEGVFQGIEINDKIMTDRIATRITDTGYYIGEQYATAGYRGYFDVDYIAAKNGELYVSESNVRRTGGTFVYKTALNLIGKDFMSEAYTLSNSIIVKKSLAHFKTIYDRLNSILFNKKTKEGVIIASANLLKQQRLLYIVIGKNEKSALNIEQTMFKQLGYQPLSFG